MIYKKAYINKSYEKYKIKNYLYINYYLLISLLFLVLSLINLYTKFFPAYYSEFLILFSFISLTIKQDIKKDINIKNFLVISFPFILFIILAITLGGYVWHRVLELEMSCGNLFNINSLFNNIPFNKAGFTRVFTPIWFTNYLRKVYITGFVLVVLIPVYRSFISLNFEKMLKYTLSTHIIQVFLITPFYFTFKLQEVWYVNGRSDMLERNLHNKQLIETTLNCFPSMHTSIAFATFILVLREKDNLFKIFWSVYCFSIIYSTLYLEIHWLLDVIFGLILGYFSVKLIDLAYKNIYFKNKSKLNAYFMKNIFN